jgi:hypothetical protein
LKDYTGTSALLRLLNSNVLARCDIHSAWDDSRSTKKTYLANLNYKRPKGRHKARRKDDAKSDTRKMGIVNWREVAQDRDGRRRETRKALIFLR